MKKILGLFLMFMISLVLTGCMVESDQSCSYVSVEINPSVELVIGEDGTVLTANGTNDDGKALIIDVTFEGKTLEEAIEIIMNESMECGYLISAEYNSDLVSKEISISISSNTEKERKELEESIKGKVNAFIEENNIAAEFEALEAKGRAYFENIVLAYNPLLTEEEVKAMSYDELMKNVELATIEKAQLASIALEEYYLEIKEYEYEIAYKEQISNQLSFIEKSIYDTARTILEAAIDVIEQIQYEVYVSEDSLYLGFLNEINQYKDKNIKLRVRLGNEENASEINAEIKLNEDKITEIEGKIIDFMNGIQSELNSAKASISSALSSLSEFEKDNKIDFDKVLTNVEQQINDTKDGLFAQFEKEFADDIASAKAQVEARKQSLKSNE